MLEIIFSFVLAFFLSYLILPSVIKIAVKKGIVDIPNERKSHTTITPSFGGVGIFLGVFVVSILWTPEVYFTQLRFILGALVIVFLVGVRDDIDPLSPFAKLCGQFMAVVVLITMADVRISSLYGLFGVTEISYWLSISISCVFYLLVINSFNLIDGINGLSSSVAILTSTLLGLWFYVTGFYSMSILAFAAAGSTIAFLKYNITPARIFMGDTGSLILGTLCAVLTIQFLEYNSTLPISPYKFTTAPTIALSIIILPVFDTIRVFVYRISKGLSPFTPDKNHIHHLLLDTGLSHMQATSILLVTNIAFVLLALQLAEVNSLLGIATLVILACILSLILSFAARSKRQTVAQTSR